MWVLLEEYLSKIKGRDFYFKAWTSIGPATTDEVNEAHQFDSKDEALMSAAYRHELSFFEPVELVVTVKNKAA